MLARMEIVESRRGNCDSSFENEEANCLICNYELKIFH